MKYANALFHNLNVPDWCNFATYSGDIGIIVGSANNVCMLAQGKGKNKTLIRQQVK